MNDDWTYERALLELWRRSSYERGLISDPFGSPERARRGLARMRALLAILGNPQWQPRMVHVAGSKGKGSTSTFIAMAMRAAGYRVGLYTSPHLHRFPERIAIDGRPLPEPSFAAVARRVARAATELETSAPELDQVTTFEFISAMAFAAFAEAACDLAVIEVGLGGLYDATNVLEPVVTAITRIDLEHTAVLGPTHAAIALQKAGIFQPGVPAVSAPQVPEAEATFLREADRVGAPLLVGGRDWTWTGSWRSFDAKGPWGNWNDIRLGMAGPYQVENACTALAAIHFLDRGGMPIPERGVRDGFAAARMPGRFERITLDDRAVVLDGAHTRAAAEALVAAWREAFGDQRAVVVVGMGADKHPAAFLQALQPIVDRLFVTRADSPRAADPALITSAAGELGMPVTESSSVAAAVAAAEASAERWRPLLVTGSLFVAGEAREAFGLAEPDLIWRQINAARRPRTDAANRP